MNPAIFEPRKGGTEKTILQKESAYVVGQIVVERWRFIAVSGPPHHITDVSCVFEPPQTVRGLSERPPCEHMWVVGRYALLAYPT